MYGTVFRGDSSYRFKTIYFALTVDDYLDLTKNIDRVLHTNNNNVAILIISTTSIDLKSNVVIAILMHNNQPIIHKMECMNTSIAESFIGRFLVLLQKIRFRCKKSGYFTKPVKTFTNGIFIYYKQVNNDTKSNNYNLQRQQNYFCSGTQNKTRDKNSFGIYF